MMKPIALFGIFFFVAAITCKPAENPASITRDVEIKLPGSERINKRSLPDEEVDENAYSSKEDAENDTEGPDDDEGPMRVLRSAENHNNHDMEAAENGLVFRPVFRTRNSDQRLRRAIASENLKEETGDMDAAESGMVFLPVFRTRSESGVARSRRSADNIIYNENEDMDLAESGMVFLPLFRSKTDSGIRRARREVQNEGVDSMEAAENGLVFRPLFRTKERNIR